MTTRQLLHLLVVVFQTLTTRQLLHLLVVDVGDVLIVTVVGLAGVALLTAHAVGVETLSGIGTAGLLLGFVHVLAGGLPGGVDLGHGLVDLLHVAGTVGGLQLVEGGLDGALLLGGNLVAVVLQVLLALEDHAVGVVDFFHLFLGLLVLVGVGLGFGFHALDFLFAEAAAGLDADVLALTGGLVEGADVEDAVGVDVEGDLNLGHSTRCRRNAGQVEAADGLVVVGHGALALQHVDLDLGLVVGSGAEDLALLGGQRC